MRLRSSRYYVAADLAAMACELVSHIAAKHEVAAIAGVPRSGMFAAAAAALHLGVPLFEAGLDGVRPLGGGRRVEGRKFRGRLVVMEDSVNTGTRFNAIREALGPRPLYASVFVVDPNRCPLDAYHTCLALPHWFDWWLFQSKHLVNRRIGLDFDGILCGDCPRDLDDDGPLYRDWLTNVLPIRYCRPHGAYAVVSGRMEKYRAATMDWCARHGQAPGKLVLGPWDTLADRRGKIAAHKARQVDALNLSAFIESDRAQAEQVAEMTGKPVACPAARTVLHRL